MFKRNTSTRDDSSDDGAPDRKRKVLLGEESPILASNPPGPGMDLNTVRANTLTVLGIHQPPNLPANDPSIDMDTLDSDTQSDGSASHSEDDGAPDTPTGTPTSKDEYTFAPAQPPFESQFSAADSTATKEDLLQQWSVNHDTFYAETHDLLTRARRSDADARQKLIDLIVGYKQHPEVKEKIDGAVRVKATQRDGMSAGTGLDEFFKTSETMTFLEWSFAPPDGKSAVSIVNGEPVDWMDAQRCVRSSTDMIIWAADQVGTISGHSGSIHKDRRGAYATVGQALMHEKRDNEIKSRSHPAGAISTAIAAHLELTEKLFTHEAWQENGDTSQPNYMLSNGHNLLNMIDVIKVENARQRDKFKQYLDELDINTELQGDQSPVRQQPTSPRYDNAASPIPFDEESDELLGASLGSETQVRWENFGEPLIIPSKRHPLQALILAVSRDLYDKIKGRYGRERRKLGLAGTPEAIAFDNEMDDNLTDAAWHVLAAQDDDDEAANKLRVALAGYTPAVEASPPTPSHEEPTP